MSETMNTPPAPESIEKKPEQDQAPVVAAASVSAPDLTPTIARNDTQSLVHIEPVKRQKSGGEYLFNATTYGGFALIGNEVTATQIVNQAEKQNIIGRTIRSCGEFFKKIGKPGKLPYIQERMNYINFAIIGGFLMVPFIKMLEDNKGRCVRFADRLFYGEKANDPEIAKRHEEMDNAPKQTWGSLGKGRLITVAAAYTVDSTINWERGLLARALKGTRLENHASLEHLSNHAAEWMNTKLSTFRKLNPEKSLAQKDFLKNLVGLTTLSATLTILFYFSSKLFARKQEEKIERREMRSHGEGMRDEAPETADTTPERDTPSARTPTTQIHSADRYETLTPAPALAQGA